MTNRHPSFLDLDRVVLGEIEDEAIRRHIADCERCRAHVEKARTAGVTPGWARRLRPRPSRRPWLWAGSLASIAATAAIVSFVVTSPDQGGRDYTTVKGAASVAVHIKRGDAVTLWDGHAELRPADAIRIEVAPDEHDHVAVFAASESGYVELYNAPLPNRDGPTVLPKAWKVDAEPGPETIVVVLSRFPVAAGDLHADPELLAGKGVWLERLTLHKDLSRTDQP